MTISFNIGDTTPIVTSLKPLTPDTASSNNAACESYRVYTGPTLPAGLSTFSVDSVGDLTTTLDGAQNLSLYFVEVVTVSMVVDGVTYASQDALVAIDITNLCETTLFTFDSSVPLATISHNIFDTTPIVVALPSLTPDSASAGYALCQSYRVYSGPSSLPVGLSTLSIGATGDVTSILEPARETSFSYVEVFTVSIVIEGQTFSSLDALV